MKIGLKERRKAGAVLLFLGFAAAKASAATLLGYYPFQGNYNDASGNGNHAAPGQNPGEVSIVSGGFRGMGADINDPAASGGGNSGGTIDIPINANPNEMPAVSFGGWVNVETYNGFTGFMAIDNGGWDRGIQMQGNWGLASGGNLNNVAAVTPGSWQYVVATFDKPGNAASLYVGGDNPAIVTTAVGTRADAGVNPGLTFIEIGRYDNQDFDGLVDEMFVFEGALDAYQVNALRNMQLSNLNFAVGDVAALFNLHDASASGLVGGLIWSPVAGLDATNPGEVFDQGGGQWAVVLDGAGNGLVGVVPEPSVSLMAGLAFLLAFGYRRRRE